MWRLFVFLFGGLLWPLTPAVMACGNPVPPPAPKVEPPTGDFVKKSAGLEIKGKLTWVRCVKYGRTSVGIEAGGGTYWLDVHGDERLGKLLGELHDKTVVVTGELEQEIQPADLVRVRDVRAAEAGGAKDYVKKSVAVEILGNLQIDERDIRRPHDVAWFVKVDGQNYYLHLKGNKTWSRMVRELAGTSVLVTGTLEQNGRWMIVHVNDLKAGYEPEPKKMNVEQFSKTLIGLEYAEATKRADAAGYKVRLIMKDGESFPGTTDWQPNRINISVAKGKVVAAKVG